MSMRITAGTWRNRRIASPEDPRARPTTERVREAWMAIVQGRLPGARCVDLFAGTGAMGLEALSRGAASCDFVELYQHNLDILGRNIRALEAEGTRIVRAECEPEPSRTKAVSPVRNSMQSKGTPRKSEPIWRKVVSCPCPLDCVPITMSTRPSGRTSITARSSGQPVEVSM